MTLTARTTRRRLTAAAITLLVASTAPAAAPAHHRSPGTPAAPDTAAREAAAAKAFGELPLRFEPNAGQADPAVRFLARTSGATVYVTDGGFGLHLAGTATRSAANVHTRLEGAAKPARVEGVEPLPGVTNYLLGEDPAHWRTGLPGYAQVAARQVYPGTDLVLHDRQGTLEYDFQLQPGADPAAIRLAVEGASAVTIGDDGDLVLTLPTGDLRQRRPVAFQLVNGQRAEVPVAFRVDAGGTVGFDVGPYDRSLSLVIDPTIVYSTFLGGSNFEESRGIAIDGAGAAYVIGVSGSVDFPIVSPFQGALNGEDSDAVVTKLAAGGNGLMYSTYLGGAKYDTPRGIAVEAGGAAYVVGLTHSADFPTTASAFQRNRSFTGGSATAGSTAYTASSGIFSDIDAGRYITGPNLDVDTSIAEVLSPTSVTLSTPAVGSGAGLAFSLGGRPDGSGFLAKLAPAGTSLSYASYLGGSGSTQARAVAASSGVAYVTGSTSARNFPTSAAAFDGNRTFSNGVSNGTPAYTSATASFSAADVGRSITGTNIPAGTSIESVTTATSVNLSNAATGSGTGLTFTLGGRPSGTAFLTTFNATGTALGYSTYLGGDGGDTGYGVALAGTTAVVAGATSSSNFPVSNAIQAVNGGNGDGFVTRIDPAVPGNGSGVPSGANAALTFSTFLGGTQGGEEALGVAVAASGIHVVGWTSSADFPVTAGALDTTCGSDGACNFGTPDAFAVKMPLDGSALTYSTYLGGSGEELARAVAVGPAGNALVAGETTSLDFPVASPIQLLVSDRDAFVTRLAANGASATYSTYLGGSLTDAAVGVAVDSSENAYVTGSTTSADFPTKVGSFDLSCGSDATCSGGGNPDMFVTKLSTAPGGPALGAVAPKGGPPAGGTNVTLTGSGFTGTASVTFGGVPASFHVDSDARISAVSPPHAPGLVGVTVANGNGTSISTRPFRYGEGLFEPVGTCPSSGCGSGSARLANGKILVMRPGGNSLLFDPAAGTWQPTGACTQCANTVRVPLTLLPNGKVLYEGGIGPGGFNGTPAKTAYLYDPAAGTWSQTGSMVGPRFNHSATLLPNGKVLVAGGCTTQHHGCGPTGGDVPTFAAELYDPATGAWAPTGEMNVGRGYHPAIVLDPARGNCGSDCGRVLVAGGVSSGALLDVAELYDVPTGTWIPTRSLHLPRYAVGAVQLFDGRVLVVGGYSDPEDKTAELYDAATRTWSDTGPLASMSALGHAVTLLPSGKVLAAGRGEPQIYAPASNSWALTPPTVEERSNHIAELLTGSVAVCGRNCGGVLLAGGVNDTAEVYRPQPAVSAVSPAAGSTAGRTLVKLTGTGLAAVTEVRFGATVSTNVAHDPASPDTVLLVRAPAHAAGQVDVVVRGPGGDSPVSLATRYTFDATLPAPRPAGDYDADGTADLAVFRPSTAVWYAKSAPPLSPPWGATGDLTVPGDYDGDGKTDLAVFRPGTGVWYVRTPTPSSTVFGVSGDLPVPADYDGDGKTDVAVFRPSTGTWYVKTATPSSTVFGTTGDVPVPADYDGDGKADLAVYRPSTGVWYVNTAVPTSTAFGITGDVPVPGDYDGDGKADLAVFRPGTGTWYVKAATPLAISWGSSGDVPVPADYDGDGKLDLAVFRPGTAVWYVRTGTPSSVPWGAPGDIPLPLPSTVRQAFFPG